MAYYKLNQYDQADPLFKEALSIQSEALGPDHPSVNLAINNEANKQQIRRLHVTILMTI